MLGSSLGPVSVKRTYSKTRNSVVWGTGYSNVVEPTSSLTVEDTSGYMLSGLYHVTPSATAKIGYEYTKVTAPFNADLTEIQTYYGMTMQQPATNASGKSSTSTFWLRVTSGAVGRTHYIGDRVGSKDKRQADRASD
jgi:hypothetical protein